MVVRDRRERFVSLAEARTDKALNAIRMLGNLANRSNYDYQDAEIDQIIRALEREVRALKAKFQETPGGRSNRFRLAASNATGE